MRGYESEEGYIQRELLKTLSEGDLVGIEYYAPKYNKRLTTLFVVPNLHVDSKDMYMFELKSWRMDFIIYDFRFHDEDIENYNPIIKSIIYKRDLDKIEHKVVDLRIQENKLGGFNDKPSVEELLKDWDSPENKAITEKVVKETIDELNKQMEIKEEMISNPNYIEWLCNFTKKNGGSFYSDDWDYKPGVISDSDMKNVNNLGIFFEGIEDYAENNNILFRPIFDGSTYFVRYNDVNLEIGFMAGQGSCAFSRMIIRNDNFINNCVDFNEVLKKNRGRGRTRKI